MKSRVCCDTVFDYVLTKIALTALLMKIVAVLFDKNNFCLEERVIESMLLANDQESLLILSLI